MFTVRSHSPKGPSSAPFSSPGGAVVAFGGRFPALLLLLGLVFIFLPVYFCVRFSWVFALPAYRPWSFIFLSSLGSAFSGGRLRRLILLRFRSLLPGGSFFLRSCLSSRASVPRSWVPLFSPWPFSLLFVGVLLPCNFFLFLGLLLSLYPLRFCSLLLVTSFLV